MKNVSQKENSIDNILKQNSRFVWGIMGFILIWALVVLFGIRLEPGDDLTIAYLISRTGIGGTTFVHKALVVFLHKLYEIFPLWNWWTIFSIQVIAIGTGTISYVLSGNQNTHINALLMALVVVLIYYGAVVTLNFTRTAGVIATAGLLLIRYYYIGNTDKPKKKNVIIIGIIELLLAISIRRRIGQIALIYLFGGSVTYNLIPYINGDKCKKNKILRGVFFVTVICSIVLAWGHANEYMITESEEEYCKYNSVRSEISDYVRRYPDYKTAENEYKNIGLSENDVKALQSWITEDPTFFTVERMSRMAQLKSSIQIKPKAIVLDIFNALTGNGVFFILASISIAFSLYALISLDLQMIISIGYSLGLSVLLLTYLSIVGRQPPRTVFPILIMCTCDILLQRKHIVNNKCNATMLTLINKESKCLIFLIVLLFLYRLKNGKGSFYVFMCLYGMVLLFYILKWDKMLLYNNKHNFEKSFLLVAISLFLSVLIIYPKLGLNLSNREKPFDVSRKSDLEAKRFELLGYVENNPQLIFIAPPKSYLSIPKYSFGYWMNVPENYCDNAFLLGGWDVNSPYMIDRKESYNIENPIKALIDSDCTVSFDGDEDATSCVLTYIREHYDAQATYTRIAEIKGSHIIKFQEGIKDSIIRKADEDIYLTVNIKWDEDNTLILYGDATNENINNEMYCNLTYDGKRFTYHLPLRDDKSFCTRLEDVIDYNNLDMDSMVFFTKIGDQYVEVLYANEPFYTR